MYTCISWPTHSFLSLGKRKTLIIYRYIRKRRRRQEEILVLLFCLFLLSFNLNIHAANIYCSGCCYCRCLINPLQSSMCMKRKREISHWSRLCSPLPYRSDESINIYICNIRRKKEKEMYRPIRKWMSISNVCFFLFSLCVFFIKDRNRKQK